MSQPIEETTEPTGVIFAKVGSQRIELPEEINNPEQAQDFLSFQYPEVKNADVRRKTDDDGNTIFEFSAKPGRKG
ncbi:MAG: PRTRC system protein C [Chloroflexota bacterium]